MSKKEVIINKTIELMNKTGNVNEVKIRDVAKEANVSVGNILYHFGSKDNLINQSVRVFLSTIISQWDIQESNKKKKIRFLLEGLLNFLDKYSRIAKISIIYDHLNPSDDDNTIQTIKLLTIHIMELYEGKNKQKINKIAHNCVAQIHHYFLRSFDETFKPNFFNEDDRKIILEYLLDIVLNSEETYEI